MTPKAKIAVQIYNAAKGFEAICAITGDKFFPGLRCRYDNVDEFLDAGEFKQYSVSELEYKLRQLEIAKENGTKKYKEILLLQTEEGKAAVNYRDEQCEAAYKKRLQRFDELKEKMNSGLQHILKMDGIGAIRLSDYNIEIGLFDTYIDKKTGEKSPCLKFGHSFTAYMKDEWIGTDNHTPALEVNFGTMGNFCVACADESKIDNPYIKYVTLLGAFCNSAEAKKLVLETMKKCRMMNNITDKVVLTAKEHYDELVNNIKIEI